MGTAAILCIDGELDVHDTCASALAAAIVQRTASTRIGIAFGDVDAGEPIAIARELVRLAPRGGVYASGTAAALVDRSVHDLVDLGAASFGGHAERWQVFALGEVRRRERFVAVIDARPRGARFDDPTDTQIAAEIDEIDRHAYEEMRAGGGLLLDAHGERLTFAFDSVVQAMHSVRELSIRWLATPRPNALTVAIDGGELRYMVGRWWGQALMTADRLVNVGKVDELVAPRALVEQAGLESWFTGRDEIRIKGRSQAVEVCFGRLGQPA